MRLVKTDFRVCLAIESECPPRTKVVISALGGRRLTDSHAVWRSLANRRFHSCCIQRAAEADIFAGQFITFTKLGFLIGIVEPNARAAAGMQELSVIKADSDCQPSASSQMLLSIQ